MTRRFVLSLLASSACAGSIGAGAGSDARSSDARGTDGTGSGSAPAALVLAPYKDTSIDLNWNTNVISTSVSGTPAPLDTDLVAQRASAITIGAAGRVQPARSLGVPALAAVR